ncbi:chalcone isomerase family protein [Marinobacterium mangrovicola]|uniref:Chalcone isomerase-like protein n=1 Tax=Marinobacterium mangrovicola TaxID=1476959 RepID=A0A4R1GMV2_9GAMM|nr:chalcone isomerase family protein [Marinobacterium mangrovicola]TCK08591.1 chalcone isomerase-like protein [Marinobacterium mangrovicola]
MSVYRVNSGFRVCLIIALMSLGLSASAQTRYPQGLEQVGQARLSLLWLDIYDARLFSPDGAYRAGEAPLLLELTYHRAISSEELVEETLSQLEGRVDALAVPRNRLNKLLPSVDDGDQLAFYLSPDGRGAFYFNREYLGELENSDFNRAFLDIWLAPDSDYPELTQQLIGKE